MCVFVVIKNYDDVRCWDFVFFCRTLISFLRLSYENTGEIFLRTELVDEIKLCTENTKFQNKFIIDTHCFEFLEL